MSEPALPLLTQIKDFLFRDIFYFVSGLFVLLCAVPYVEEYIGGVTSTLLKLGFGTASSIALVFLSYVLGFALLSFA